MAEEYNESNFVKIKEFSDSDKIDLIKVIRRIMINWPLYGALIFISLLIAFIYLEYSTPQYKIHAKILVKDAKKGGNVIGSEVFQELDLFDNQNSVDNEVELLNSRTLMEKTLISLQLNVRYFIRENFGASEIYAKKLPFNVNLYNLIEDSLSATDLSISIIDTNSVKITYDTMERIYKYSDTIFLPFGKMLVTPGLYNSNKVFSSPILIQISKKDNTVASLQNDLSVAPTTKTVSTIDLSISDPIPQRGEDVLNTLLSIYNLMNKDDKNRIADSTIAFIDDRLKIVSDELGEVEGEIQGFRELNKITDISSQGKLLMDNLSEYSKDLTQQEVQIEIVKSLEDYLKSDHNESRFVPATLTVQEPTLLGLVQSYNASQMEKDRQLQITGENSSTIQKLNILIRNSRNDILSTLGTIKNGMILTKKELESKINFIESQLGKVPKKERTFLQYSRQQAIKQELYLYLLKKKEETAVTKSANVDNARIVDTAKSDSLPFKPNHSIVYVVSLLFGISIATAFVYLKELFNRKIQNKSDITSKTSIPILAEISHNSDSNPIVIYEGKRSIIAEQFRVLRTNLQYVLPGADEKSILITSSMSGEGKSFLAINLATVIALAGKRVVLMELDLRKPKISKVLGIDGSIGFSNYAIGSAELDRILLPSKISENMFIIPSGLIPPNPSELIMLPRIKALFALLKSNFDYIVMDTSPLGLVTDAQLLAGYADCSLFVVRRDYTFKQQLTTINHLSVNKKLPKLNLIVNDVKEGYGYGYGYDYGYANGYFESKKSKNKNKS